MGIQVLGEGGWVLGGGGGGRAGGTCTAPGWGEGRSQCGSFTDGEEASEQGRHLREEQASSHFPRMADGTGVCMRGHVLRRTRFSRGAMGARR